MEEPEGNTYKQEFTALKMIRKIKKVEKQAVRKIKILEHRLTGDFKGSTKKQEFEAHGEAHLSDKIVSNKPRKGNLCQSPVFKVGPWPILS